MARTYANAERLLRAQGNQAGRGQLTSKVELRNAFHPRGIVLATGEDIPNGLSLQALLVLIKVALGASETSTRKALAWLAAVTPRKYYHCLRVPNFCASSCPNNRGPRTKLQVPSVRHAFDAPALQSA